MGAEAHAGFMPWDDWDALDPANGREATPEAKARANKHRALAVLFGDGAGALVFRATDRDAGLRAVKLHTDGGAAKFLYVEGGGFRTRPYWKHTDFDEQKYIPTMDGRELFKFAVTKLPECARALCAETGTSIESIRLVSRPPGQRPHQRVRARAAGRAAREAAVEHRALRQHQRRDAAHPHRRADARGKLKRGQLCMLLALGAGVHWGCALLRL